MTCAMALYKSPTVVHFYLLRISNPTVIPRGSRSLGVDRRGTKRRRQTWIDFDVPLLSLRDLRGFKPECEDINLALSAVIYPVCAHDSSCLRRLRRLEEIRKYMRNWRKFIELSVSPRITRRLHCKSFLFHTIPFVQFIIIRHEWPLQYNRRWDVVNRSSSTHYDKNSRCHVVIYGTRSRLGGWVFLLRNDDGPWKM